MVSTPSLKPIRSMGSTTMVGVGAKGTAVDVDGALVGFDGTDVDAV